MSKRFWKTQQAEKIWLARECVSEWAADCGGERGGGGERERESPKRNQIFLKLGIQTVQPG